MAGKARIKLLLLGAIGMIACEAAGTQASGTAASLHRLGSMPGRISESSGVAVSRAHSNVLWTHNDSGDRARVFAVDTLGNLIAEIDVDGARNRDWEDISLGPCPDMIEADWCLLIADTGDNAERRRDVDLYFLPEPDPYGAGDDVKAERIQLSYENGSHDVEGVALAPDGTVWLVSKGRSGRVFLYRITAEQLRGDHIDVELLQVLPITPSRQIGRWITGASVHPDGDRIAIRSYTELYILELSDGGVNPGTAVTCWLGASEPQGEAVDWFGGDDLIMTSEAMGNLPATIHRAACPG